MKCEFPESYFVDCLSGQLKGKDLRLFKKHLSECGRCREIYMEMKPAWQKIASMPEPRPAPSMKTDFYRMLEKEKACTGSRMSLRDRLNAWLQTWWPGEPVVQLACFIGAVLLAGFFVSFVQTRSSMHHEMSHVQQDMQILKRNVSMSLLQNQAASDRLKGIALIGQIADPGTSLVEELIDHINHDPNTNVRLAAVDAVALYSDLPEIRTKLTDALNRQDSPSVQIAIIDILIQMNETRSLRSLKAFIENRETDPIVREHTNRRLAEMM
ncbi:HEAT repeat domain-containing protein [bacterium]|nr:HEAT repeat domain-containing protein [bacterium]